METEINQNSDNIDLLLYQILKLWLRNMKQVLDQFKLTFSQFEILSVIYNFRNSK